jgi:uncharacterized protein YjbI with pentapeptide repeats
MKATLNHCIFEGCKLIGVHFEDINPTLSHLTFTDCDLSYSTFTGGSLKKMQLKGCICHEVDFTEANLSETLFDNCDLLQARFQFTDLQKANLLTSFKYSIDPTTNKIKGASFAYPALLGLLDVFKIKVE